MALPKISLAVFLFFALAMATTSAQNTPQDFVNLHNIARAADGVGPVTWDSKVAKYAQDYAAKRASDCNVQHSGGPYGENLIAGSTTMNAAEAVAAWQAEKKYYDYDTNTCIEYGLCGHYTQLVWRDSTRIGCARVECDNGGVFIACNYDPPGNIVDERPFLAEGERTFLTLHAAAN